MFEAFKNLNWLTGRDWDYLLVHSLSLLSRILMAKQMYQVCIFTCASSKHWAAWPCMLQLCSMAMTQFLSQALSKFDGVCDCIKLELISDAPEFALQPEIKIAWAWAWAWATLEAFWHCKNAFRTNICLLLWKWKCFCANTASVWSWQKSQLLNT
jgi:hypothetical protein